MVGQFEAHAARTPDAVAVIADGVEVSYGELNARADRLAHFLHAQDVRAESVVGLCLPRGIEMVAAILAVWKAGPRMCRSILRFRTSGCASCWPTAVPGWWWARGLSEAQVVTQDDPRLAEMPGGGLYARVTPAQTAYVIYTSGSTGRPKVSRPRTADW